MDYGKWNWLCIRSIARLMDAVQQAASSGTSLRESGLPIRVGAYRATPRLHVIYVYHSVDEDTTNSWLVR